MAVTTWLIDKSAYIRLSESTDAELWIERTESSSPPLAFMPVEYLTPTVEDRAVDVQLQLAERGQHRAPSIPDLIIAATAEISGLTVLALDKDFELIAAITGQPIEPLRLAP